MRNSGCQIIKAVQYIGNRRWKDTRADIQTLYITQRILFKNYETPESRNDQVCVGGKYSLTVFGRAIYEVQILLAMAVHNYGKLKNLDSISLLNEASVDERFVDNIEIKILS